MDKLLELGAKLGLEGKELRDFVLEREKIERDERAAQREAQKAEAEAQKEAKRTELQIGKEKAEAQKEAEKEKAEVEKARLQVEQRKNDQEFELQKEKLRLEHEREINKTKNKTADCMAKAPELPIFKDDKDHIDSYIERFERHATLQNWDKSNWALQISSLLTGRALDVYARLSSDKATDYQEIKAALLKNYNLTEEGYRTKFRMTKPEDNENPEQFITRIGNYLDKWIQTAAATNYNLLKTLIIKEQFLDMCPKNVAIYLNESPTVNIKDLCERAERFLQAHNQKLNMEYQSKPVRDGGQERELKEDQRRVCYNCGKPGHIKAKCRNEGGDNEQQCSKCKMFGHLAEVCRNSSEFSGMLGTKRWCTVNAYKQGNRHTKITNPKNEEERVTQENLKVVKGNVNHHIADTLRDSGCSTICVNKKLILPRQLTGRYRKCKLMDGTEKRYEVARVDLDTPYIKQDQVAVLCVEDLEFDIIVGEVSGARCQCDPDPTWKSDRQVDKPQTDDSNARLK